MNTKAFTRILFLYLAVFVIVLLSAPQSTAFAAVIDGTPGDDVLQGTAGADTISGDIRGGDYFGDDVIYGDGGNDTLYGEYIQALHTGFDLGSDDIIYGGDGDDTLVGDGGATSIYTRGIDRLYGERGNDRLFGYGLNDYLDGGEGNDYLYAGAADNPGNNEVYGGPGNDHLVNHYGSDVLDGGEGYDILDHSWIMNFGVTVNLSTEIATVVGTDQVRGIEEVWGSKNNLITHVSKPLN